MSKLTDDQLRAILRASRNRDVKVLSVRQPWAWSIATGHKDVENRSWSTTYRGPLAIHAGKAWDREGMQSCRSLLEDYGVVKPGVQVGDRHLLATGAIVAVVDLVGVCPGLRCRCSGWGAIGFKHWKLRNARPLADPAPVAGRLGLWDIDLKGAV